MMKSILACLLTTVVLTAATTADSQQPKKIPRIGFLSNPSLSIQAARTEAFQQGLRFCVKQTKQV